MDREIEFRDSISNVGSEVRGRRGRSASSLASSRVSRASSAMAAAAAKKATLRVQAAALNKFQALEEEELRLKHETLMLNQRQDQDKLRLQQRLKELQLETEIAKADAEEKAYARTVTNDEGLPGLADIKPAAFEYYNRSDPVKENISCAKSSSNTMRTQSKKELDGSDNSETAELFLQDMIDVQRQQLTQNQHMFQVYQARDQHLEQLLDQQRQLALSMTLPKVEVPTFGGDPINYSQFIRSFETLIENKTASSSARLSYLIQYTSGDAQEFLRSCLTMNADDGYQKARSLLKRRYGENHRIATAYVDRIINGPVVKDEDGKALHKLSILITSCKNTLQDIEYQHRLENPENLLKVVSRLPFSLRKAWRDVADDISSNQLRDITFDDLAKFVEKKARTLTHPIFGKITREQ